MGKLTHGKVRALTVPGRYGDGGTLHLVVSPRGTKSWVQRISIDGRRHDLGLGGWPVVSLAMARDRAFANRRAVAEGRGPLAERRKAKMPSFEHAVERVIAIHGEAWKDGGKTASHWRSTLREYAFPLIGEKPVDQITTADVMSVLVPIWSRKHETARKVRRRIGTVMKWAVAQGHRQDNPAGDAITAALPKRLSQVRHRPALPHSEVAAAIRAVYGSRAWIGTKLVVFPSARRKPLSDMTLSKLLKDHDIGAVPHGFRSSFRDWASERTNHPREVIEAALAHVVRNQTEVAYARSDLFERRRELMEEWATYVRTRNKRTSARWRDDDDDDRPGPCPAPSPGC